MAEFLGLVAVILGYNIGKTLVQRAFLGPKTVYTCRTCGLMVVMRTKTPQIVSRFIAIHENSHGGRAYVASP